MLGFLISPAYFEERPAALLNAGLEDLGYVESTAAINKAAGVPVPT